MTDLILSGAVLLLVVGNVFVAYTLNNLRNIVAERGVRSELERRSEFEKLLAEFTLVASANGSEYFRADLHSIALMLLWSNDPLYIVGGPNVLQPMEPPHLEAMFIRTPPTPKAVADEHDAHTA